MVLTAINLIVCLFAVVYCIFQLAKMTSRTSKLLRIRYTFIMSLYVVLMILQPVTKIEIFLGFGGIVYMLLDRYIYETKKIYRNKYNMESQDHEHR